MDEGLDLSTGLPDRAYFHFFRNAKICKAAISDFDHAQQVYHDKRRALMIRKPSLKQQRLDSKPYVSLNQVQHSVSPYFMNEKRSDKTFMSGYTGFIPRSRSRWVIISLNTILYSCLLTQDSFAQKICYGISKSDDGGLDRIHKTSTILQNKRKATG